MATGSDAFLWYNVGGWADYGFAVPNCSNDMTSQNGTIRDLAAVMGRNLQGILLHPDSRLRVPPSINTITRMHKLCTRARSILASRAVPDNVLKMETAHALPSPEDFLVFPCPYFRVRNSWMKSYAELTLLAITEAMQHQENARPLEISTAFAGQIGQYIQRVYRMVAVELLRVPFEEANKPDFTITETQLKSYNPSDWFTSTEMIDVVPRLDNWPTEDDLELLTNGIPVSQLPSLNRWPSGGPMMVSASSGGAPASTGESFAPPPGA